ncbi:MAG: His/Gly/Thr/Pro-type tRNA ligase C-terminal domain-containing protein, partial [Bacteroidota bacterium]
DYSHKVSEFLKNSDIRASVDERDEKIGKKIRDAEIRKVPYMLIVGEKEAAENTVSVRKHGQGDMGSMSFEKFSEMISEDVNARMSGN